VAKLVYLAIMGLIFTGIAAADMPLGFYAALNNGGESNSLCVVNYQAGAALSEKYADVERLERDTEVKTRYYDPHDRPPGPEGNAVLEASINSNVVGQAHIAWVSFDPVPNSRGRHVEYGRSVEDLVGVFSVEKFVQLWDNSTTGKISIDWMPCV